MSVTLIVYGYEITYQILKNVTAIPSYAGIGGNCSEHVLAQCDIADETCGLDTHNYINDMLTKGIRIYTPYMKIPLITKFLLLAAEICHAKFFKHWYNRC